jgi:vacuolar protein sorting-associated protein 52
MEKLRVKASEKICEFFYKRVEQLKTPNTNIAIIQKSVLLKYKELYWFLLDRYVDVANEVKINYVSVGIVSS